MEVPVGAGDGAYDYIIGELKKMNYEGFSDIGASYGKVRRA